MNHRKKQECECGNDTYNIQVLMSSRTVDIVASCSECGRVTGSVGDGKQYRGTDIHELIE